MTKVNENRTLPKKKTPTGSQTTSNACGYGWAAGSRCMLGQRCIGAGGDVHVLCLQWIQFSLLSCWLFLRVGATNGNSL